MSKVFFSSAPFPQYEFTIKSIGQIYTEYKNSDIITHPCQRNFIWTSKLKQGFLTTISRNGPITGPQLNKNDDYRSEIMDGQNRIKTIIEFMDNEIMFMNEDGETMTYTEMSPGAQRKFKNTKVSITETSGWTPDQCEDHYVTIQEGSPLTHGEIIKSSSSNPVSIAIGRISNDFGEFIERSIKKGGMGIKVIRYKHYEIIGTMLSMCMPLGQFPQKSSSTSLSLYNKFEPKGGGVVSELNDAQVVVRKLLGTYKTLVENIDELKKGKCQKDSWENATGEAHMYRSMYLMFRKKLYSKEVTEEMIRKFANMNIKTHLIQTDADRAMWDEIKLWAQNDVYKIYDKYLEFYNETV